MGWAVGGEEEGHPGSGRERDSRRDFRASDPLAARPARPRLRPIQEDLTEGHLPSPGMAPIPNVDR